MRIRRHNRQGVLNTSNPDWNEDRGSYGHGYQNHGYESDRGRFNYGNRENYGYTTSIGGRYDDDYGAARNYNERGGYTEDQFSRDSGFNRNRRRYMGNRNEEPYTYDDWRSRYGSEYNPDYLNYGSERGANDRTWDEFDRSNYQGRNYNRGGNFGGGNYGSDYNRNRRGFERDERGWWDRTTDEVSSWFGDEDAERRRIWDRQRTGQHRGKGPKGYSRSDDRIEEDINDRLSDDVFIDASEIEVSVNQGDVTLSGTVNERNEKRRAEDIAEDVSGVRNVENRIRVNKREWIGDTWKSPATVGSPPTQTTSRERGTNSDRNKVKETM